MNLELLPNFCFLVFFPILNKYFSECGNFPVRRSEVMQIPTEKGPFERPNVR